MFYSERCRTAGSVTQRINRLLGHFRSGRGRGRGRRLLGYGRLQPKMWIYSCVYLFVTKAEGDEKEVTRDVAVNGSEVAPENVP